jgi:hypothetical protein
MTVCGVELALEVHAHRCINVLNWYKPNTSLKLIPAGMAGFILPPAMAQAGLCNGKPLQPGLSNVDSNSQ